MKKNHPDKATSEGICYLVGAGPGDIGLVTLRAKECIEQSDVVLYDHLSNPALLRWAREDAELIYVGKKAEDHALSQGGINQLMVERTGKGKKVCRLKGGDPMIFGRGGEEAEELKKAGVAFEIVPGISSAIAGPTYAGIPVTHRAHNSQLTILTGHEDPAKDETSIDYAALAAARGTKVFLMAVQRIGKIAAALVEHGADPEMPVAMVRWATTGRQETLIGTLATIESRVKETGFEAPAVTVIGEVVNLREELNWFESRPLFGKRVLVTRTRKQSGVLSRGLAELGADVYEMPTIRIEPPEDLMSFGELVQDCHGYDWILFTSPNGVDAFFEMYYKLYDDARSIGGTRIGAIGPGTKQAIAKYHIKTDLLPEVSTQEGFMEAFEKEAGSVDNLRILWVRPAEARDHISKFLQEKQAILDEAIGYRTVPETEDVNGSLARFKEEGADLITFTSSSTVEAFLDLGLPLPEQLKIASIGPITTQALVDDGLYVDMEAESHDIPGLVDCIVDYFSAMRAPTS